MSVEHLVLCAKHCELDALKREISKGTDINGINEAGWTALTIATERNNHLIINELLKSSNLDIFKCNGIDGSTALMYACQYKNTELIEKFLESKNSLPDDSFKMGINKVNKTNNTALLFAVGSGNLQGVKELLKYEGIDVNIQDDGKETALIHASLKNYVDIVKELLKHPKIAVNIQNGFGETALTLACWKGYPTVVRELLTHTSIDVNIQVFKDKNTALIIASREHHTESVKELLKHPKINVNVQNNDTLTALMIATIWQYADIVKELLGHKDIDITIKNKESLTALDLATKSRNNFIVCEIEKYSANLQAVKASVDRHTSCSNASEVAKLREEIVSIKNNTNTYLGEKFSTLENAIKDLKRNVDEQQTETLAKLKLYEEGVAQIHAEKLRVFKFGIDASVEFIKQSIDSSRTEILAKLDSQETKFSQQLSELNEKTL